MPPRHWKTFIIWEIFPAWVLWNDSTEEIVNSAYSVKLAKTSAWKSLNIVLNPKFKNIFPDFVIDKTKQAKWDWWVISENWINWWYYAVWIKWALTWLWYTIGIIDDPTKNRKEAESIQTQEDIKDWFTSVFMTRQQQIKQDVSWSWKWVRIIIVMTRWHTDDLTWFIEENEKEWWDKYKKLGIIEKEV